MIIEELLGYPTFTHYLSLHAMFSDPGESSIPTLNGLDDVAFYYYESIGSLEFTAFSRLNHSVFTLRPAMFLSTLKPYCYLLGSKTRYKMGRVALS